MTETGDPQLPQGSFATGKWVFPKRPLKDQTAGVHPKMSNPSLATAKDYGALTALGDLHRTPVSGVVHGYSRGQQDAVALCRSVPSIRSPWCSQSSPHHRRPGPQRRPRRPKLPLMVAYGCHSPAARRSLDVTVCHWMLVAGSFNKKWSRYVKTVNKYSTNPLAKSPPKSTSSAITSQGAPLNKKITVSQESICIWFMATHILATHLPFTKLHPCHLGQCTKRAGLPLVKICSRANCVLLCYTTDIAAASEYRSVQSNTYAGMTSDASYVRKGERPNSTLHVSK